MNLFKLLGIGDGARRNADGSRGTLFDHIERLLPSSDENEVKRITGYAGLLGRVASADMDISFAEQTHIRTILQSRMKLSTDAADAVVAILIENRVTLLTIEEHIYGRLINDVADRAEKLNLMHCLFELAAVDDISLREDTALHRIAKDLNLSHGDVVDIKQNFLDRLSVLKKR